MSSIESEDTHYKVKIELFETNHNYLTAIMLNQAKRQKKKTLGINSDGLFQLCRLRYLTLNRFAICMVVN